MVMVPEPGTRRTRAMACLRRPTAAPGTESTGRSATTAVWSTGVSVEKLLSVDSSIFATSVSLNLEAALTGRPGRVCTSWQLSTVRGVGPAGDLELAPLLGADAVLGEHASDGLLDGALGVLGEELVVGDRRESARVARVAVRLLLLELLTGEGHLLGVDDDDEVTGVDVGGEGRLVLAAEQ